MSGICGTLERYTFKWIIDVFIHSGRSGDERRMPVVMSSVSSSNILGVAMVMVIQFNAVHGLRKCSKVVHSSSHGVPQGKGALI